MFVILINDKGGCLIRSICDILVKGEPVPVEGRAGKPVGH